LKDHVVQILLRDNGLGIPKNIIDKVFQPFFTTKKGAEGTGLGLSISYDIVKSHGGAITLRSVAGEETAFEILLPLLPLAN
jgi:signal transduction histidine kinase